MIFQYTDKQTSLLAQRDARLGKYISSLGYIRRDIFDDVFEGICYNIINQQLSMKACNTLWNKLNDTLGTITPQSCDNAELLKNIGLSRSKAECIAEISRKYSTGELSDTLLHALTDEEVIRTLTKIKGIGPWTAEMTLIFCLQREDILSLSDYGIRKGLSLLHGIDINDKKTMNDLKKLYSPYGTIASFYLWEIARIL